MALLLSTCARASILFFIIVPYGCIPRLKSFGPWNRLRPTRMQITTYLDILINRTNIQLDHGVHIHLTDVHIPLNRTVVGIPIEGSAELRSGSVTQLGQLARTFVPPTHNRSEDGTMATIHGSVSLFNVSLLYNLEGRVTAGRASGSVEVHCQTVDFAFHVVHEYTTGETRVLPDTVRIYRAESKFLPMNRVMYGIQKSVKDIYQNIKGAWYGDDFAAWHKTALCPLLQKGSVGVQFPIEPVHKKG